MIGMEFDRLPYTYWRYNPPAEVVELQLRTYFMLNMAPEELREPAEKYEELKRQRDEEALKRGQEHLAKLRAKRAQGDNEGKKIREDYLDFVPMRKKTLADRIADFWYR